MEQSDKEFTEFRVPVPWGFVAMKVYGPPREKKALVVHGILDNAGSFDRLIALLPNDYQYACVDLPGHGLSSHFPPGLPLNFFDYVLSVKLILDGLKWKTCTYIGHSFGAQLGVFLSIFNPERIEKIVAIDSLFTVPIEDDKIVSYVTKVYDLNAYTGKAGILHTKEAVLHALQYKRSSTLNLKAAEAMFTRAVTKVDDLYRFNRDPRLRASVLPFMNVQQNFEFMRKISVPLLLFLANGSDRMTKYLSLMKIIEDHYQNSLKFRVIIVTGNHDVHNNNPENLVPDICDFLNDKVKSKL